MMYQADSSGRTAASLEDYIAAVRQRYWAVILGLIIGLVLALWFQSSRVAQYEAEAKIVLGPTLIGSTNGNPREPVLEREAEIVGSDRTASAAAATVSGVSAEMIIADLVVDFVPNSEVISIRFQSGDPTEAAEVANAVADSYVAGALEAEAALLTGGSGAVAAQVAAAEAALGESQAEVDRLTIELGELRRSPETAVSAAAIDRISTELASEQATLSLLTTEVRERRRELALNDQQLASLQPPAEVLSTALRGSLVGIPGSLVIAAGTLLGAIAGLVAAVIGSRLDRTARDETSVAASLGTRVLGALPRAPFSARSPQNSLFMSKGASGGWVAGSRESIRRLRSSVQFVSTSLESDGGVVLTVTSAFPREGKSTTITNLAVALAQSGSRTVLINADMRRPSTEAILGIELDGRPGLSEILGSGAELVPIETSEENLWLVPAGPAPANPAELLGSSVFNHVLKMLRAEVDYVLIDCPPVLSAADPLVVSRVADGVIVVVDARRTGTPALLQVRSELEQSGATIIGAVMNRDKRSLGSRWRRDRYIYSR